MKLKIVNYPHLRQNLRVSSCVSITANITYVVKYHSAREFTAMLIVARLMPYLCDADFVSRLVIAVIPRNSDDTCDPCDT